MYLMYYIDEEKGERVYTLQVRWRAVVVDAVGRRRCRRVRSCLAGPWTNQGT